MQNSPITRYGFRGSCPAVLLDDEELDELDELEELEGIDRAVSKSRAISRKSKSRRTPWALANRSRDGSSGPRETQRVLGKNGGTRRLRQTRRRCTRIRTQTQGLAVRGLPTNEHRPPATKLVVRTIPSVNAKSNHVFNMSGASELLYILHLSLYIYLSPAQERHREGDRDRKCLCGNARLCARVRACSQKQRLYMSCVCRE